jgi:DNA-binding MarR family transcriptional regulator
LRSPNGRKNYGQQLEELGRQMGMHSILFHNAVAERLGLNLTDHKCLDYILRHGNLTAGQLSRATGLTSGAITGVIDRLEKAGYVRREPDARDRRKVIVVPRQERIREIGKLFESLGRNMARAMSSYSAKESEVLIDFMTRVSEVMRQENLKLRKGK